MEPASVNIIDYVLTGYEGQVTATHAPVSVYLATLMHKSMSFSHSVAGGGRVRHGA